MNLLTDDGISGITHIRSLGLAGFPSSYGHANFYFVYFAILNILECCNGVNFTAWLFSFVLLHSLNATTIYYFFNQVQEEFSNIFQPFGLFVALAFLFSPYASENVVWAATAHYASSLFFFFVSLILLHQFLIKGIAKNLWLFHVLFILACLTIELSFLFTVVHGFYFLLFYMRQKSKWTLAVYTKKVLVPQIVFTIIYCVCHKLYYDKWLPPDRSPADTHLQLSSSVTFITQQLAKFFGFVHFFEFKIREVVYSSLLHWKKALLAYIILVAVLAYWFRKSKKLHLFLFLIISGIVFLVPFIKCYFMYLYQYENDRYLYFSSPFFFAICFLIFSQFSVRVQYLAASSYLILLIVLCMKVSADRSVTGMSHVNYLSTLPVKQTKGKLYLLNVPMNCRGGYMFRYRGRLGLAYEGFYEQKIENKIRYISFYNAQSEVDSFDVERKSDSTIKVQMKTNGSWWHNESFGAVDYECETHKVLYDPWGGYEVTFLQKLDSTDAVVLYNKGKFVYVK